MATERKLFSATAEKRALRTLCSGKKAAAVLAASLRDDHFVSESCLEAYRWIKRIHTSRGIMPRWFDVLNAPGLAKEHREALAAFKQPPVLEQTDAKELVRTLGEYRKLRGLRRVAETLYRRLSDDSLDPDDIIKDTNSELGEVKLGEGGFRVNTIGKGGNTRKLVLELLNSTAKRYVPTGIQAFDGRSQGIARGSLFMVAGPTGGGKSVLLNKLARNFALAGAKVGIAPLEMDNPELVTRTLAEEAHINMEKFTDPRSRMSAQERKDAIAAFDRLQSKVLKVGGRLDMVQPQDDMDIDSLLIHAKAVAWDVVIIDYVGLLEGADGDDQPRALSRIARKCKIWASINRKIVVLGAQLSEEGQVRYSRALTEHASNQWSWTHNPFAVDNHILTIIQNKARNQAKFDFQIYYNPAFMEMRDLTDKERKEAQDSEDSGEGPTNSATPSKKTFKMGGGKPKSKTKTRAQTKDYFAGL